MLSQIINLAKKITAKTIGNKEYFPPQALLFWIQYSGSPPIFSNNHITQWKVHAVERQQPSGKKS